MDVPLVVRVMHTHLEAGNGAEGLALNLTPTQSHLFENGRGNNLGKRIISLLSKERVMPTLEEKPLICRMAPLTHAFIDCLMVDFRI